MKKAIFTFLVLAAGPLSSALALNNQVIKNTNGWQDTVSIVDTLETDTIKYSAALVLTDGEDCRVLMKANATTAGFNIDSLEFQWGYQTGLRTIDSSDSPDTIWDAHVILDTMLTDSIGKTYPYGITATTGATTMYWSARNDTSSVAGFACQSRWFVPEWGELIRFWAKGMTEAGAANKTVIFEMHRRIYSQVRTK